MPWPTIAESRCKSVMILATVRIPWVGGSHLASGMQARISPRGPHFSSIPFLQKGRGCFCRIYSGASSRRPLIQKLHRRGDHMSQTRNQKYRESCKIRGIERNKGDVLAQTMRWRQGKYRWRLCGFDVWLNCEAQMPKWSNSKAVVAMYRLARRLREETGCPWVVDHIIPLRGNEVMGLHTHLNLQIILADQNRAKGNLALR